MRDLDLALTAADDALHFLPAGSDIGREADLAAWTAGARHLGIRVNGYYNPYVAKSSDNPLQDVLNQGIKYDWFLHDAKHDLSAVWLISGSPLTVYSFDFTYDQATSAFQAQFDRALKLGYSGWMYDFGEYVQPDVVGRSGMTGEELHDLYPVLYQKAAFDYLEAGPHKGDWFFFARSGYTGAQQYTPMVWSGDPTASFEDALGLPAMVRAGINMGMSGVAHWGSDIGGFKCIPDGYAAANDELLARWIEVGALMSNMQDQDACSQGMGPGMKASIWNSPVAQQAWKTYARLHTRLQPYFLALAKTAHETGAPTIRHPYFEHPERPELVSVDDEYYLGPSLLIAPVVKRGATQRDVTLPFIDFLDWSNQKLIGAVGTVTVNAPIGLLPILIPEGGLVPMLDPSVDTLYDVPIAERDPSVVGPADVANVYDVVGFLSTHQPTTAEFTFVDGGTVKASWQGNFSPPALPMAASEADLQTCNSCWLKTDVVPLQLWRVRITAPDGDYTAGTLSLSSKTGRKVRWDLYLKTEAIPPQ
jgi:alpha-glucosidase (family GH31 glycosyl hydrolase)